MSGAQTGNDVVGRVALRVGGQTLATWTQMTCGRDLRDITGRFDLGLWDQARAAAAMPDAPHAAILPAVVAQGQDATLTIDGEPVMTGYVDIAEGEWTGESMSARVAGRDRTGDLADCAAAPTGPAEYRGITLLQLATLVCAPFAIAVRAETDIGAPFERLAVNPHESALSLLEKAARQRSVLVVSDGVGGLLLTTGGRDRAPADLLVGRDGNVLAARYHFDWSRRYSDVWVKGQLERSGGGSAARTHATSPAGYGTSDEPEWVSGGGAHAAVEAQTVSVGHAVDPEITRYRPVVRITRTQSGAASAQAQAEWWVRVTRGESTGLTYSVLDWRAAGALWRPNQVVRVRDAYAGIDDDMLIRAVTYRLGPDGPRGGTGPRTEISVVGLTAFDRTNEAARRRPLRVGKGVGGYGTSRAAAGAADEPEWTR